MRADPDFDATSALEVIEGFLSSLPVGARERILVGAITAYPDNLAATRFDLHVGGLVHNLTFLQLKYVADALIQGRSAPSWPARRGYAMRSR